MIVFQSNGVPIKAWVGMKEEHHNNPLFHPYKTPDIEDSALEQLWNLSELPFVFKHIAVMPDVHFGIGATIGSVVATKGAIIPAAVGVDIGCGMNAVRTSLIASVLPDSLAELRHDIERSVPVGFNQHRTDLAYCPELIAAIPEGFSAEKAALQIGTLGGGNHFIEVCLDEEQRVWVMLHSGSRGIGNQIGTKYISEAKKLMEKYFISLPDMNLAYLPVNTSLFTEYWNAVDWAQTYALENRKVMMKLVLKSMVHRLPEFVIEDEAINCHHNYVAQENHFGQNVYVTRKGAVRARSGDLGIIPGSMGTKSYIVRGCGNADSFNSCSHGAGRAMSRAEARKRFTLEDHIKATEGVECKKNLSVIDETPAAYKDIDVVMENQKDLVEIVHTLKQVLCVKG